MAETLNGQVQAAEDALLKRAMTDIDLKLLNAWVTAVETGDTSQLNARQLQAWVEYSDDPNRAPTSRCL